MYYRDGHYEVLSENPIWIINENDEVEMVPNIYSDMEVIRYYLGGDPDNGYIDTPIEDTITLAYSIGGFVFKTQEEANRYILSSKTEDGLMTILDNYIENMKRSSRIQKFKEIDPVPNGLYVIPEFDECLNPLDWTLQACALTLDYQKKYVFRKTTQPVNEYLIRYLKMIDIEKHHDLGKERVLFEVYSEDGYVYITHYFLQCYMLFPCLFFYTRIMNYPVFDSEIFARNYKIGSMGNPATKKNVMFYEQRYLRNQVAREAKREARRTMIKNIALSVGKFAWENKAQALDLVKRFIARR